MLPLTGLSALAALIAIIALTAWLNRPKRKVDDDEYNDPSGWGV